MERANNTCKVISVYSNSSIQPRTEYAINLTAALAKISNARVALITMDKVSGQLANTLKPDEYIDVLTLDRIDKQHLEKITAIYRYMIIDHQVQINESAYELFSYSDAIHMFVTSTHDDLKDAHRFLEDLFKKGLKGLEKKVKVVIHRLNIFDKFSVDEMSWLLRRDVWAIVPEGGMVDALIDSKGVPIVLRSGDSAYSKAVLHIAKSESGKLLGLVLGSGAAFGLAHIGVLKVLERNNIPIDVISGSSIGSLIAALWGVGLSSDKIERIAKRLSNRLNIIKLLDFTIPISGILAGKRLKRFLRGILREKTFEDLQIPVKIMVYDLANRQALAIEKGLLVEAVYTSIAVPGIFGPKVEKERVIVDGGVADPVPVDILLKRDVKKIIAVNVLPGPEDIHARNMLLKKRLEEEGNMMRTGAFHVRLGIFVGNFFRKIFTPNIFDVIMTSMQSIEYLLGENSCRKADIALHPVFSDATSIDFHLVKDFIKRGEEETTSHIKEIKELVSK